VQASLATPEPEPTHPMLGTECNVPGLGSGCWSVWLNRDQPSGFGDDESLTSLRDDGLIPCSNPTSIECETIDGRLASSTGQTLRAQCTLEGGVVCANSDNPIALGRRLTISATAAEVLPPRPPRRRRLQFNNPEPEPEPAPEPALGGSTHQRVTCADYRVRVYCPAEDECTPFGGMITDLSPPLQLPGSAVPTDKVCCAKECGGYCGAVACAEGPGGPDACCPNTIATSDKTCGSRTVAPCKMPDHDITCDPCVCDLDGVVNGIDTGRPGCAVYQDTGKDFAICAVTDGCHSLGAEPLLTMPGAAFRPCREGAEPHNNFFCTRKEGKWDTVLHNCTVDGDGKMVGAGCANCTVFEQHHRNIPVVGPSTQRSVSYVIEHSYGAVVAARLRDAWLQSDCDLTDSVADHGDPERGVRPDGRFGTYNEPVARPDHQSCKHRFYGDEWNVSTRPLGPMETQITVMRQDADAGWAYDGLRVEYSVCGQDLLTGAVTQGQGLWRPTLALLGPIGKRTTRDWDNCRFYRTGECSPEGPRLPALDLSCTAQVREGWSGYCQCADGRKTYHVGCENHPPFSCSEACRVPEDWHCDPHFFDDGACDVACGASDPDCSREVVAPWSRLQQPAWTGHGPRRTRDSRGWS
jgi:hypothetical protein